MRDIIYIANIRLPTEKAHGLQTMKTCEALAGEHHGRVTLVIPRRWRNLHAGDPFLFYGVRKNFDIRRIWCIDFLFLPLGKRFWFWIESASFAFSALFHVSAGGVVYYTRDAIVALLFGSLRKPVFYEIHSLPDSIGWIYRLVLRRCRGLVVISRGIREDLVSGGISEDVIRVIPDAVDFDMFSRFEPSYPAECRKKLKIPEKPAIVYTGHLYAWKGTHCVAEAAPLVPDAEFYIVGGTHEDILRFRRTYHVSNLHIAGWEKPSQIPLWICAADIVVIPTSAKYAIGRKYTSPLKLFEAMALRARIVAADVPSIREIVSEKEVRFFEPDNARSLAEVIRRGLEEWKDFSEQAHRAYKAVHKYTWKNRARSILSLLS